MIPLAIWLVLIGYTIAIAGKRNLGVSYAPQADGSIKPVDGQGNPARTYSLMDVVTCSGPSTAPAGAPSVTKTTASGTGPSGDCKPQPGDIQLAGGFLWRPQKPNLRQVCLPLIGCHDIPGASVLNDAMAGVNGRLVGPCP